jgi:hypothetical protein
VLTRNGTATSAGHLRQVCALEELDPSAEHERIGLVVLAGSHTRLQAVDGVKDLMSAAGWPLLGVLGDSTTKKTRR